MKQLSPYPPHLLEHARHSRYRKMLAHETIRSELQHPSCGDRITVYATIIDNTLTDVGFEGTGCLLSQAAASVYLAYIHGKSIAEIQNITSDTLLQQLGITLGPKRAECALLIYETVKRMLHTYIHAQPTTT